MYRNLIPLDQNNAYGTFRKPNVDVLKKCTTQNYSTELEALIEKVGDKKTANYLVDMDIYHNNIIRMKSALDYLGNCMKQKSYLSAEDILKSEKLGVDYTNLGLFKNPPTYYKVHSVSKLNYLDKEDFELGNIEDRFQTLKKIHDLYVETLEKIGRSISDNYLRVSYGAYTQKEKLEKRYQLVKEALDKLDSELSHIK
jgi:hypothetical protein